MEAAGLEALTALTDLPRFAWPRRANALILEGLAAADRAVLEAAVSLAGRTMHGEVAARLGRLLEDGPDLDLRLRAARALGYVMGKGAVFDFDVPCDPTAVSKRHFRVLRAALRRLFHAPETPPELRRAILETGARGGEAWAVGATRSAWRSGEAPWRRAAVACMAHLPGFEAELLEALDDPGLASAALSAAAVGGVTGVGPRALALASSPDQAPDLRRSAIAALGELAPPGARAALEALASDGPPGLCEAVHEALEALAFDPPAG